MKERVCEMAAVLFVWATCSGAEFRNLGFDDAEIQPPQRKEGPPRLPGTVGEAVTLGTISSRISTFLF